MSPAFRYRPEQVRAFVAAPKCLRDPASIPLDKPLPFKKHGESGRKLDDQRIRGLAQVSQA